MTSRRWTAIVAVSLIVDVGSLAVPAFGERLAVRRYSTADGLSNDFIIGIYRDAQGFLWFSTRDGLSRFDGQRFTNYGIYARWWFIVLAGAVIAAAGLVAYRARVAQLLRVERVRARIATDLHDDIGASLSQIAILAEKEWSEWRDLGGQLTSAPAVASWGVNRLDVFARGQDDHLLHKRWNGTEWSEWRDLDRD